MDVKILENQLQVTTDRWNLSNCHHQFIQKRIMVDLGLLKSGKVELRSTIDQGSFETVNHQGEANSENFVMGSDAAEFVNKVKDQVRNRQKKNVERCRVRCRAFKNMRNVHGYNVKCGDVHWKDFLNCSKFRQESVDLTLKQMFDVTAQFLNNEEEIHGLDKIQWERILGNVCHWLVMKLSSIIKAQKSIVSRILCCASEGFFNIPNPSKLGRTELQESETMTVSMGSRWNSSGISSEDSFGKINDLLSHLGQTPAIFTRSFFIMSMFNDISCDRKVNKDECLRNAESVKVFARRFGIGQWSFIGPGCEKKWSSMDENNPCGGRNAVGTHRNRTSYFPCNDSIVQRYIQERKDMKKLSIHVIADYSTIETVFRIISCQSVLSSRRSGQHVWRIWSSSKSIRWTWCIDGQSIVLGEIRTEIPLQS